jgi:hypothetical protein
MRGFRLMFAAAAALVMAGGAVALTPRAPALMIAPPLIAAPEARTPIRLQAAAVDVAAAGSLARTTVLLTLYNPNDRLLQGELQFPLQPGQQVSAFALDIDGEMRDAVPVPKETGRQVFESIERRQADPALLEQTAGNQFRLRVYPIPARGTRTVRLTLDQIMSRDGSDWRLDLPLHLLGGADDFTLAVSAAGARQPPRVEGAFAALDFVPQDGGYAARARRQNFRADHGLALRFAGDAKPLAFTGARAGEHYVVAEIPVGEVKSIPRALPKTVGLLWDASASARQRDRGADFAVLDAYFAALGNGEVRLRLLRDVGEDGGAFPIRGGDWRALRRALENAVHDGASNLAGWQSAADVGEYLLFSDGLHNWGEGEFPALSASQRLYALNSAGPQGDAGRLAALAESRGGRAISWQGIDGAPYAAALLLRQGVRVASVGGEGVADGVARQRSIDDGIVRVAARLLQPRARVTVELDVAGARRRVSVPVAAGGADRPQAATLWAQWQVGALMAEPQRHQAAIERLGRDFGLVTANTSLLVLDDPADYVRHDIPAPAALRDAVAQLRARQGQAKQAAQSQHLDAVAARFEQRYQWWQREFPKGEMPLAPSQKRGDGRARIADAQMAASPMAESPAVMAPPPPAPMMAVPAPASAAARSREPQEAAAQPPAAARIRLQPWQPDSPYARRLRDAPPEQIYALYLDERDSHAGSTAFYLDVAELLLQRGQRALALRVLSNLAEMELENRHILRVLGYRLMQAEAWPLAVQTFRRVRDIAGEEPQSWRDLGLALVKAGEARAGIEMLYEVVRRPWDARFGEIDAVALNELNAVIARAAKPLDTAFIDPRLRRNMPLDLRAVLAWDSDNSDMDLHVTDPNGEECYFGHRLTYQGGMISRDFTGGYGPEEFILRHAKPGKYRVQAHYFGDRRQEVVTGGVTLTLTLSTGWATPRQRDQTVTLRLSGRNDSVLVGEFEVE